MNLDEAKTQLQESGLKLTRPRALILEAIFLDPKPFTADELHTRVRALKRRASCDLATLYRALSTLEKIGLIHRFDLGGEACHYEWAGLNRSGHRHHIVCRLCRRIDPIDSCFIEKEVRALSKLGYRKIEHRLEFSGVCEKCA